MERHELDPTFASKAAVLGHQGIAVMAQVGRVPAQAEANRLPSRGVGFPVPGGP